MAMPDQVSVIVPVYNVERYLERCVDSILAQSYENIEIILVDDGSQDRCPTLCDSYAAKHSRIKVLHQQNAGLSAARNAGLQIAGGEWVTFIDSDDYVSHKCLQFMLEACKEYSCDCAVCKYIATSEERYCFDSSINGIEFFTGHEAVIGQFGKHSDVLTIATNKLFRRALFNDVRFPEGRINEDVFTIHEALYHSKKVALVDCVLYAYFQRPGSIMRKGFEVKRLDLLEAYRYRIQYYEKLGEKEIVDITRRSYCNRLCDAYWLLKEHLPAEKALHLEVKEMGKKEYAIVRKIRGYSDLSEIRYCMIRFKQFCGRYLPIAYNALFVRDKLYI